MKLYITRHGKTKWNTEGRFQGTKDSSLNQQGIKDAYCLKEYSKDLNIDAIY